MESGCHKGRDAEADPSRLISGTRGCPGAQMRLDREPDVPAPHSWAAGSREAEEQAGHTAGRPGRILSGNQISHRPSA